MKKLFYITAILATVVAAASCKKGNQDDLEAEKLEAPALATKAIKLELPTNNLSIKTIEFTEAGRYLLTIRKDEQVAVKAGTGSYIFKSGSYTVSGTTYTLNGWGTVNVSGNKVTATPNQGAGIDVTATPVNPLPENDFYVTLARTWKVDNVRMSVTLNGNAVTVTKQGCDLPAIAEELKQKGVSINTETVAGYVVKDIIFTRSKTFAVEFTGKDPLVGEFVLADNGNFSYSFTGNNGNDIFNANAKGNVQWVAEDQQLVFTISADVTSGSSSYTGSVVFWLSEVK